jgi:hypothetical protein
MLNYSKNSKLFTTEKKCNFLRMFSTPKFVTMYVFFKKIMGSTRSHPLPPGMPTTSSEFDGWTDQELVSEINRLTELLKIRETEKIKKRVDRALVWDDDDNIMNDPDVRKMVENGEHICHMFDGECLACEMDEDEDDDGEVRVLTEEEVQNDPEMTAQVDKVDELRAHFC